MSRVFFVVESDCNGFFVFEKRRVICGGLRCAAIVDLRNANCDECGDLSLRVVVVVGRAAVLNVLS